MEIDLSQPGAAQLPPERLRASVCIVGAGIAGLTLAHQLAGQGIDVLLLEAGGLSPGDSVSADPADLTGDPYPAATTDRPRAFGGTSLLWGGQLLPLPPDAAWPIAAAELAPHLVAAERLLAVDPLPYDGRRFFPFARQKPPALLAELPGLAPRLSKFVPFARRNLAATLGRALRTDARVQLLLHATVTELELDPAAGRVTAALITTPGGTPLHIEARHFVLAAGAIESVRLLLASRSVAPEGIGNQHGQLGRNLHDHLTLSAATLHDQARARLLGDLRPWVFGNRLASRTLHSLKLEATPQLRTALGLTPVMAHLTLAEPSDSGPARIREALRARQQGEPQPPSAALHTLSRAFAAGVRLAASDLFLHRRYVSPEASVHLQINAAQATPAASRITLSDRRDEHGLPLAAIDFRIRSEELHTLHAFGAHLRERFDPLGLTPASGVRWLPAFSSPDPASMLPHLDDARHTMGGAIMGTDPRTSVVDPSLAVHGLANLSIASTAVFPDGSAQLPSLTLMALTLRLAEQLTTVLRNPITPVP